MLPIYFPLKKKKRIHCFFCFFRPKKHAAFSIFLGGKIRFWRVGVQEMWGALGWSRVAWGERTPFLLSVHKAEISRWLFMMIVYDDCLWWLFMMMMMMMMMMRIHCRKLTCTLYKCLGRGIFGIKERYGDLGCPASLSFSVLCNPGLIKLPIVFFGIKHCKRMAVFSELPLH